MKIYNHRFLIKDYDDDAGILDVTEEMLDKLDAMLTAHGIGHAFTYPMLADYDTTPSAQVALFYDEDDLTAVFLVCALWQKTERRMSDERIMKSMKDLIDHTAA